MPKTYQNQRPKQYNLSGLQGTAENVLTEIGKNKV